MIGSGNILRHCFVSSIMYMAYVSFSQNLAITQVSKKVRPSVTLELHQIFSEPVWLRMVKEEFPRFRARHVI